MSILIKGVKMPQRCFECFALDTLSGCYCDILERDLRREHGINISRPEWCPLIELAETTIESGDEEMTEIKPCPFCGGEARMVCTSTVSECELLSKTFIITCGKCGVRSPKPFRIYVRIGNDGTCTYDASEKDKAIEAWNRRADDE